MEQDVLNLKQTRGARQKHQTRTASHSGSHCFLSSWLYRETHFQLQCTVLISLSAVQAYANTNIYDCRILRELEKEARMRILHHINIVALLAVIMEPDHYGLVMEYVHHGALDEFILTYCV